VDSVVVTLSELLVKRIDKEIAKYAKSFFSERTTDRLTIALWILALSSHAFLLPKFIREMSAKK
jgi:hypothetical protein